MISEFKIFRGELTCLCFNIVIQRGKADSFPLLMPLADTGSVDYAVPCLVIVVCRVELPIRGISRRQLSALYI